MGVTKRQLEQAWVDLGEKYGGVKEDYFALLYLAEKFEKPPECFARQVAFGGNDYGLDAFHVAVELRNLYLYQFKWSNEHALFKGSLERLARDGIQRLFGNPTQDPKANPFVSRLKMALDEYQGVIERVYVHFVFNGDPEGAEQSAVLSSLREDLEARKHYLDDFFGRNVQLALLYVNNKTDTPGNGRRDRTTRRYEIPFEERLTFKCAPGATMHVGLLPLAALYRWHQEMGPRLFDRNIRFGLSADKSPNRALRKALSRIVVEEVDDPTVFAFNHNGVTLSAERLEVAESRCTITEPRVLNGAQTVTSLAKFLEDNRENPALSRNRSRLEAIRVLTRVITNGGGSGFDEFLVNVTVANNRQNPVEPWHLRAADRMQLELADKFLAAGFYYERAEGAFEALSDSDIEDLDLAPQAKAIEIRPLAQTLLAMQGEIDKMSRLREVFEDQKLYSETFRESYLSGDVRRIVLAYKIRFRINRTVREIVEKGEQRYAYLHRARNLVWALLIQALLNDDKRDVYLDDFGTSLSVEADFGELLKRLASTRVRFLIKEATSDARSKELLEAESYSFLRTRALYKRCLDAAFDKYGWKRLSL